MFAWLQVTRGDALKRCTALTQHQIQSNLLERRRIEPDTNWVGLQAASWVRRDEHKKSSHGDIDADAADCVASG